MRLWIILSLVCLGVSAHTQTYLRGEVVDSSSGKTIPYANIYLKHHHLGTTAFRDGSFQLILDSAFADSLVISCVGYKSRVLYLPEVLKRSYLKVQLAEDQQELKEVVVRPKKWRTLSIGLNKRSAKTCHGARTEQPWARYIPNDDQVEGFISSVSVYVCEEGVFDAPFRVNLLKANTKTGEPSEALIAEDFILQATKGGKWVHLDLSRKLIEFPRKGFFVAVQQLPLDSSQVQQYATRFPSVPRNDLEFSAPRFGYHFESYENVVHLNWYSHKPGKWTALWQEYEASDKTRFSTLMIKARINCVLH